MNEKHEAAQFIIDAATDAGTDAFLRLAAGPEEWAQIPDMRMNVNRARGMAALAKAADVNLDQSWIESQKLLVHVAIHQLFDEFELWCITERPDLLKSHREALNESLPPEEQV